MRPLQARAWRHNTRAVSTIAKPQPESPGARIEFPRVARRGLRASQSLSACSRWRAWTSIGRGSFANRRFACQLFGGCGMLRSRGALSLENDLGHGPLANVESIVHLSLLGARNQ